MASQVNVNALTVVHAGSDGIATGFPDVCLTPAPAGPPIPIPYPNVATSSDAAQGTKSVTVEGNPVVVQDACFAISTGDEAGSAGGVTSATTKGKARFINYAFDVKMEGRCVARLGDPMTHNELGGPNTAPFPEIQPPCPMVPEVTSISPEMPPEAALHDEPPLRPGESYVFVWDEVNERQWVNLPAAWGKECGREVTLVGHVEPRIAGRKVVLTLLPDPQNPTRHAQAELAETIARSDGDGVVKVQMTLPIYGGARFQVSARTAHAAGVASPSITVWRRVFYQLTTMDPSPDGQRFDMPAGLIDSLQGALAEVFIDLQPSTQSRATTPYRVNVGTNEDFAAVEGVALHDDRSPFKLHIVAVDMTEILAIRHEKIYAAAEIESKPFLKWKYHPTVIKAEFSTADDPENWTPLADVQVVEREDETTVIRARVPHPHPWKVQARLLYRAQRGPTPAGWGGTRGVLYICVGLMRREYKYDDVELAMRLRQIMAHEVGHGLGLLSRDHSWYDHAARDAPYTLKHCHHLNTAGKPECVMWFKVEPGLAHYCTSHEPKNCAHLLRANDLSKLQWI